MAGEWSRPSASQTLPWRWAMRLLDRTSNANDYTEGGALDRTGKNVQGRVFDWSDTRHVSLRELEMDT